MKQKVIHKDPWYLILLRVLVILINLGISIFFFLYILNMYNRSGTSLIPNILNNLPHF